MKQKSIERFFLNTLLKISIAGVLAITVADVFFYPEDVQSIVIDLVILVTCTTSLLMRTSSPTSSVLILTSMLLLAMVYQSLTVPVTTTNSLSILLMVGFICSVMLRGKLMWTMHIITILCVNAIFIVQFLKHEMTFARERSELMTILITYSVIYFILCYATAVLKGSYDRIYTYLQETNAELHHKAGEIATRNEELVAVQENLNVLNTDLEQKVNERTEKIQLQNEILLKYSYTNAHHLRGPVARLLGLAAIHKLDSRPDTDFIIAKMVEQAHEIDAVIKKINEDLEIAASAPSRAAGE
jgi:signal transduction histidine kinase